MTSAIFSVPLGASGPALALDELQFIDEDTGELAGGYACIGNVAGTKTVLVRVWCSDEQLGKLKTNPNYLWVEDVEEPAHGENP